VEALVDVLIERQVSVLILDPFVKLHLCSENDNGQMDYVMVVLKEIAIRANCAIWLIHHSGKAGVTMDPNGSRGASSIIGAARVSETLTVLTEKEREAFGCGDDVVKREATKANLTRFSKDDTQYLRVSGHAVGNGADYAQVIELFTPKDQTERMDRFLFDAICAAINQPPVGGSGVWVSKKGADNWIGRAIMMGGVGTAKRAETLGDDWVKMGLIIPDHDARDKFGRPVGTAVKLNAVMVEKHAIQAFKQD
jgi:AAA domain